jgi:hypothetical protein
MIDDGNKIRGNSGGSNVLKGSRRRAGRFLGKAKGVNLRAFRA